MKTLSLWQPWATLFVYGAKRIETRSWQWPKSWPLPAVLAVHATKSWGRGHDRDDYEQLCAEEPFRTALFECGFRDGGRVAVEAIPLGAVVGIVRLVACVGTAQLVGGLAFKGALTERERAFGNYTPGRYGWVADRAQPFARIVPAAGAQGIWHWNAPAEVEETARAWGQELTEVTP